MTARFVAEAGNDRSGLADPVVVGPIRVTDTGAEYQDRGHHGLLSTYQVAPDLGRGLLSEEVEGVQESEEAEEVCSGGSEGAVASVAGVASTGATSCFG